MREDFQLVAGIQQVPVYAFMVLLSPFVSKLHFWFFVILSIIFSRSMGLKTRDCQQLLTTMPLCTSVLSLNTARMLELVGRVA